MRFVLWLILLIPSSHGLAQTILKEVARNQYYPKMIIEKAEDLSVPCDTLMLDTLIMKKGATLTFLSNSSLLVVAHAFIGEQCRLNASGRVGVEGSYDSRHGAAGGNGRDLVVSIRFEELGSLLVTASGGNGGKGANAHDGGNGGGGGNGGDIGFYYLSPHFAVAIMEERKHSVRFENTGGTGGDGGKGIQGVRPVYDAYRTPFGTMVSATAPGIAAGQNGAKGSDGRAGILRFLKIEEK